MTSSITIICLSRSSQNLGNSTENTLLKVNNDLLWASDRGLLFVLVLLDLSATFDTVITTVFLSYYFWLTRAKALDKVDFLAPHPVLL